MATTTPTRDLRSDSRRYRARLSSRFCPASHSSPSSATPANSSSMRSTPTPKPTTSPSPILSTSSGPSSSASSSPTPSASPRIFRAGVATYEFWLKAGIILLGARFVLGDVLKLGGISLASSSSPSLSPSLFMTWLGRAFRLSPRSPPCSPSAPPSAASPPSSRHREPSTPTKTTPPPPSPPSSPSAPSRSSPFPLIGHALHMSDHAYGLWAGLAVDNTAEATAAGALYSDAAGKVRRPRQDLPQRPDRLRRPRLCHPVVAPRPRQRRHRAQLQNKAASSGRSSPSSSSASSSSLCSPPSEPAPTHPRRTRLQQSPAPRSRKPQPLGLPADLRRSRPPYQPPRPLQTGSTTLHRQRLGEIAIAIITLGLILGADRIYHL